MSDEDSSVNDDITFQELSEWLVGVGVNPAFATEVCMRAYRFGVKTERARAVEVCECLARDVEDSSADGYSRQTAHTARLCAAQIKRGL